MKRLVLLVLAIASTAAAGQTVDPGACSDALDRLRRTARDASDAGDQFRQADRRDDRQDALDKVRRELSDVSSRLRRAERECAVRPAAAPASSRMSQEQALQQIERWSEEQKRKDRRYLAIESRLLFVIDNVVATMPPEHWLPTIKLLYQALSTESF